MLPKLFLSDFFRFICLICSVFFFGQVVTRNLNKIIDINYYPVKEVCFENFNFYRWFSVNISSLQAISNLLQIIADCMLYVLMILHTYFISNNLVICIIIYVHSILCFHLDSTQSSTN